jgi:TolB-like protein
MDFLAELKRRKVIRTAAIYVAASWLLLQVAELLLEMLEVPAWGLKLVFVLLVVGFPLALILSWMHQITPEGLRREVSPSDRKPAESGKERGPDLASPVGKTAPAAPQAAVPPDASSIAVLPFANMSDDPANLHFADGLSEELLNLLSRVPGLRVVARTSSFSFRDRAVDATTIARELSVSHLLEGSVRKASQRIRITAQLVADLRPRSQRHLRRAGRDRRRGRPGTRDQAPRRGRASFVADRPGRLCALPQWQAFPGPRLEGRLRAGHHRAGGRARDRSQVRAGLGDARRRLLGRSEQFAHRI